MNRLESINFMENAVLNTMMMQVLRAIDDCSENENSETSLLKIMKDCGLLNEKTAKMAEPHIMEIGRHLDEIFKCFDKTLGFGEESKEESKEEDKKRQPFTLSKDNLKNCTKECEKPAQDTKPEIHQIVNIVNFG